MINAQMSFQIFHNQVSTYLKLHHRKKVQSFVGHQGSATTLEYYTKAKHSNAVAEIADYLTDKFSEQNQDT